VVGFLPLGGDRTIRTIENRPVQEEMLVRRYDGLPAENKATAFCPPASPSQA